MVGAGKLEATKILAQNGQLAAEFTNIEWSGFEWFNFIQLNSWTGARQRPTSKIRELQFFVFHEQKVAVQERAANERFFCGMAPF